MKSKLWITGFCILAIIPLAIAASWVIRVDPYFHYHKPDTSDYYYLLYNQRSQNDGIIRHFDYEGLITGTSMTENFKTTEAERIFGCSFIKVPYSGGSFKEINDSLQAAITSNKDLKIVIRGLDMGKIIEDKDAMRTDLGEYPTYLYNNNPFDDVQYIFNRDVIFKKIYDMETARKEEGFEPGITTFDSYSNWMDRFTFGVHTLFPDGIGATDISVPQADLTEEERELVIGNVRQNVNSLAKANPDVTFYYFITPYSAAWWKELINEGSFNKQIQAEQTMIEEILKVKNIKLYSFNNLTDITTDLNNYKDFHHYGQWINSLMLQYMKNEKCLLTEENYREYLKAEKDFYWTFNYEECFKTQEDYEQDYYAAALLSEETDGVKSFQISKAMIEESEMQNAALVENLYEGNFGICCRGTLNRPSGSEVSIPDFIRQNNEFSGVKISIDDISKYNYLIVYGKKNANHGQPAIFVYDENGKVVGQTSAAYSNLDEEWHQYLLDVSSIQGRAEIVFHGGYIDSTGSADSEFLFSEIMFY